VEERPPITGLDGAGSIGSEKMRKRFETGSL
jgi:hypothetical protein